MDADGGKGCAIAAVAAGLVVALMLGAMYVVLEARKVKEKARKERVMEDQD